MGFEERQWGVFIWRILPVFGALALGGKPF